MRVKLLMNIRFSSIYLDLSDAKKSIFRKKFQTILSSIGITIGVISIIVMVSIIEGGLQKSLESIRKMGINTIRINSKELTDASFDRLNMSKGLTEVDKNSIKKLIGNLGDVSQVYTTDENAYFGSEDIQLKLTGVNEKFISIENLDLLKGRWLIENDIKNRKSVVILSRDLFGEIKNIDISSHIIIDGYIFEVVGVLSTKDYLQNFAIIPWSTYEALKKPNNYNSLAVLVYDTRNIKKLAEKIRNQISFLHNKVSDFEVLLPLEMIDKEKETKSLYYIITTAIASMSLITGGIGIMNIMLANLAEKTREIGLRMAIGANTKRIIRLVALESLIITFVGGFIGILIGTIGVIAIKIFSNIAIVLSLKAVIIAFAMTLFSGIVFGIYPALKASKIEPMEALREY